MISTLIIFALCALVLVLWIGTFRIVRLVRSIRALNMEIAAEDAKTLWRNRWDRQIPWRHVEKEFVLGGKRYILSYDYCTPDGSLLDLDFSEDGSISPQGQEGLVNNIALRRRGPLDRYTIETFSVTPIDLVEDSPLITTPTGPSVGDMGDLVDSPEGWK